MTTTAITRRRRPRGQHPRRVDRGQELALKPLPQYLEAHEVQAIIRAADDPKARLLMTEQWRAGLRVSEALDARSSATCRSIRPSSRRFRVRSGKGQARPGLCRCIRSCERRFSMQRTCLWGHVSQGQHSSRRSYHDRMALGEDGGRNAPRNWARYSTGKRYQHPYVAPQLRPPPAD